MRRIQFTINALGHCRRLPLSSPHLNPLLNPLHHHYVSQHKLIALTGRRCFSHTPYFYKKKDKLNKNTGTELDTKSPKGGVVSDDPLDLSQLQVGITTAVSRLKDDLSKLRVGGRFNTGAIETLRVQLNKGSKEVVKLGELAQVIPKGGRMVAILVAEEEHIKPINSAIVSSNLSLTPQSDAHNALQLNILIPPPTKESRDQTVHIAKTAMEKAASSIRDSRGAVHKRLQDMQKKKIARPDDVRKAQDQMEKLTEKGQKELKDLFDAAKKALERA
ncbi:hypothetical protein ASPWEDRAFT_116622 [Aspergillus wentii DTO 134E9]|uniref:Ribosome recycling factor domain-containing protein n=1 Tax=Aspergillus wentii DTO 134E9 TaxID=1073089 RepID=A0A1L9RA76_ASPWE|nr:uncharacterized protein ASPWEDRAFT_116622 [Aspergillus wentii DTO 134E9]KAI9934392.1 hypothetical protein MW887_000006 [Aspergillus wentii]OJJ31799.1 hypothetical protein ASPWEDRAFT_116622 [Aspergillus wentii DTO 134E9]